MLRSYFLEVTLKGFRQIEWQHRESILGALAVAHDDARISEIYVFHPQKNTLHEPQTATAEQASHYPRSAVQVSEDFMHFIAGEDDGQTRRALCPLHSL